MDIVKLTTFLAPFLPFLMQSGNETATGKFSKDAWRAKAVWEKLHPKVEANLAAKEAAMDVANDPEDEDSQAALWVQLKKLLKQDEALTQVIAEIMESDWPINSQIVAQGCQNIGSIKNVNIIGGFTQSDEKLSF